MTTLLWLFLNALHMDKANMIESFFFSFFHIKYNSSISYVSKTLSTSKPQVSFNEMPYYPAQLLDFWSSLLEPWTGKLENGAI